MDRAPAAAAAIAGVMLGAAPVIELAGTARGDTDNAADGLRFLDESAYRYGLAGFALVVCGTALIVAALGFAQAVARRGDLGLGLLTVTTLAVIAGASYLFAGIIRHTSHGTIGYIAETDRGWAESAYLGTHMIGTQALLPMANHLVAAWLVGIAVLLHRAGRRRLALVGVLPALLLVLFVVDALVPVAEDSAISGTLWIGYILTMLVAQPLSLVVLGLAAWRAGARWLDGTPSPRAVSGPGASTPPTG
ncbi:hypothetical protein ACOACQ_05555 [Nocardioides sp. CPCC 206347]|uniref:hypothetical protein n=1 Tax=unclassified Nocardioides TaxID=2615069 RepID=UPI003623C6A4